MSLHSPVMWAQSPRFHQLPPHLDDVCGMIALQLHPCLWLSPSLRHVVSEIQISKLAVPM
eukprot:COSAG05_NODE_13436_length_430_cov_1.244713_1_plen_59_part_01